MVTSTGVQFTFMRDHGGEVRMSFSDPAYVRADNIIVDLKDNSVHAVLYGTSFLIGDLPDDVRELLGERRNIHLSAMRVDGSLYEHKVPVSIYGNA